jgi:DNA-binding phage protein
LIEQEVFPTTTLIPGKSIMRPATIPMYLHTVRYETVKTFIIEARVTIKEKRNMSILENPPAELLSRMNTVWKPKRDEALSKGDV